MPGTGPALSTHQVVELLDRNFGGALDRSTIQTAVLKAMSDLGGSISAEALHEMAYQLARYRLASCPLAQVVDLVSAGTDRG